MLAGIGTCFPTRRPPFQGGFVRTNPDATIVDFLIPQPPEFLGRDRDGFASRQ
jgi:hypothetical protein